MVVMVILLLLVCSCFVVVVLLDDVVCVFGCVIMVQVVLGECVQLVCYFLVVVLYWLVVVLICQWDVGDVVGVSWLCVDLVCMVLDMYGVWMMVYGEMLWLMLVDSLVLLLVLQFLFVDVGFVFDVLDLLCWYLWFLIDLVLLDFNSLDEVLGDDLFLYLLEGEGGCCWWVLMIEVQVLLYNYFWNQQCVVQGQQLINLLWFWGGGVMLVLVSILYVQVCSCDVLLQGLVLVVGVVVDGEQVVDVLVDLCQLCFLQQFGNDVICLLLVVLKCGELQWLVLDFEDGLQFQLDRGQCWQFWKKLCQFYD